MSSYPRWLRVLDFSYMRMEEYPKKTILDTSRTKSCWKQSSHEGPTHPAVLVVSFLLRRHHFSGPSDACSQICLILQLCLYCPYPTFPYLFTEPTENLLGIKYPFGFSIIFLSFSYGFSRTYIPRATIIHRVPARSQALCLAKGIQERTTRVKLLLTLRVTHLENSVHRNKHADFVLRSEFKFCLTLWLTYALMAWHYFCFYLFISEKRDSTYLRGFLQMPNQITTVTLNVMLGIYKPYNQRNFYII